jgi:hypothetical protein
MKTSRFIIMMAALIAVLIILLCSCSASKKAERYNESVKRGISGYVQDHPCVNDTITTTKTDTITETQLQVDTAFKVLNDTVTLTITKKEKTTIILHDTVTATVTDNKIINFWRDSASAANRTAQNLQTKNSDVTVVANDWKHKARLRLYFLIAVATASVAWTFRKYLIALV